MNLAADDKTQSSPEMAELKRTIKELQCENAKLQEIAEMFRLITENSADGIWRLDPQFRFAYASPAALTLLGYPNEELVGKSLFSILTPESVAFVKQGYAQKQPLMAESKNWGSSAYTVEAIHKDGHHMWVEVMVNPIFDGHNQLAGYNGVTRDVSERHKNEEMMLRYAFRDPLTNLPNRRLFENALKRAVVQNGKANKQFAVMFLDVDGLKKVNDRYGHVLGDALLKIVANRIRRSVRKMDFVARLAGDEFMAILPELADNGAVGIIASRLIDSCSKPINLGNNKVHISVSIGVSFFPEDADDVATLMDYADQAMYRAKKHGGGRLICFSQEKLSISV